MGSTIPRFSIFYSRIVSQLAGEHGTRNALGATASDGQKRIIFAGGTFNCGQQQRYLQKITHKRPQPVLWIEWQQNQLRVENHIGDELQGVFGGVYGGWGSWGSGDLIAASPKTCQTESRVQSTSASSSTSSQRHLQYQKHNTKHEAK